MDETSLEITGLTDLSLSADDSEFISNQPKTKGSGINKQLLEHKQLIHDCQLLKIELSQKELIIDNLKSDYVQKVEELEERLVTSQHDKKIMQARLEAELQIQQEEGVRRYENVQKELSTILKKQKKLESLNEKLQERAGDIRESFEDLLLTPNQYQDLNLLKENELALKDFISKRVYEFISPWKKENEDLKQKLHLQTKELQTYCSKYKECTENLKCKNFDYDELKEKFQKSTLSLTNTLAKVKQGEFKIENYDKIESERNKFESELVECKTKLGYAEASLLALTTERDSSQSELHSSKQAVNLLQQDKDYYFKQVTDMKSRLLYSEEKVIQLNEQLEKAKSSREELYDKYIASRDISKNEYEEKLRQDLDKIRLTTNTEVERLKSSTKEMYERENRNLIHTRDVAIAEKDRALLAEQEILHRYDALQQELRNVQIKDGSKLSEMQNEVRVKSFETERTHLLYEETKKKFNDMQLENEKLQKKLEVLTKEYYSAEAVREKRISELEAVIKEKNIKLDSYEQLEQELDEVILQSADVDNEKEAENNVYSYGFGATIPIKAKRRLKQSVHLAKKLLNVERTNTRLHKELKQEKENYEKKSKQLKELNLILDQSQQPHSYLIESIRTRDNQLSEQNNTLQNLQDDNRKLKKERDELLTSQNKMSHDLEKLLNQKEELSIMKQLILNLSQKNSNKRMIIEQKKELDDQSSPGLTQFTKESKEKL